MEQILNMMKNQRVDEQSASILVQRIFYELEVISNHSEVQALDETINLSISFIENNFMEEITLKDIATHVKLSTFHFSRIFKKQTNFSPYQYLISYRINKAKSFLHHTKLSIGDITFKCGFNSAAHFVTTFKKHTGLSIKQFREIKF